MKEFTTFENLQYERPDFEALKNAITAHTKAVLINSPNNPSGVVYDAETLQTLADILREKGKN